ncbi:MAG TPA: hypothetical protein PLI19_00345 [Erysipelotrichaceae bacterium]|nr:hypothetical protein [Erysipelotrichaceae bacterium]
MTKKKFRMTKEKRFQIVNTLLIVGILAVYLGRLIYFRDKYNKIYQSASYAFLSTILIDRIDYGSADRLVENEDGTYTFVGNVTNNYISFSGNLYRIISIDANNNIKIIAEESITVMPLFEKDVFYNTSISQWLNKSELENSGIYEKIVKNSNFLVANSSCVCQIDNFEEHTCSEELDLNKFSLLSLKEYLAAGGQKSYLNNGESFWLGNRNSEDKYYLVNEEGAIGVSYSASLTIGVRPVLTLNSSTTANSGDGTKENPFVLMDTKIEKAMDAAVGSYVQYSGLKWRVESIDGDRNVILIMADVIRKDGADYSVEFGSDNHFTLESGLGYYLNNDFLAELENYEDYLVIKTWTYGTFTSIGEYDYRESCYSDTVECYVAIPNISFKHLKGNENIFVAHNGTQSNRLVCVINEDILKYIQIDEKANVKPVICLNGQIMITSGTGKIDDPFILEVVGNE